MSSTIGSQLPHFSISVWRSIQVALKARHGSSELTVHTIYNFSADTVDNLIYPGLYYVLVSVRVALPPRGQAPREGSSSLTGTALPEYGGRSVSFLSLGERLGDSVYVPNANRC